MAKKDKTKPPTDPQTDPAVAAAAEGAEALQPPAEAPRQPCPKCQGAGVIVDDVDPTVKVECPDCEGTGEVVPVGPSGADEPEHSADALTEADVNPVQAAADLAAAEPAPATIETVMKVIEHMPDHLVKLRTLAYEAERNYNAAAEGAKDAKKAWEKQRAAFEQAFDAEVRRDKDGKTPGLPFDGVHMSTTPQPTSTFDPPLGPPNGPAEIRQFPRAVPDQPPCAQCGHAYSDHTPNEDGDPSMCGAKTGDALGDVCACGLYQRPAADENDQAGIELPAHGDGVVQGNPGTLEPGSNGIEPEPGPTTDPDDTDPTVH